MTSHPRVGGRSAPQVRAGGHRSLTAPDVCGFLILFDQIQEFVAGALVLEEDAAEG